MGIEIPHIHGRPGKLTARAFADNASMPPVFPVTKHTVTQNLAFLSIDDIILDNPYLTLYCRWIGSDSHHSDHSKQQFHIRPHCHHAWVIQSYSLGGADTQPI